MVRILDYSGRDADRTVTVSSLRAMKGTGQQLVQVTAGTSEEAAAAEAAGIDMVACLASAVTEVRAGSSRLFVSAAIDFDGAVTEDDLLRDAFNALNAGADAVITARAMSCVRRLTAEDLPVMGHLGFVPKKSTLYGGVRPVGKTVDEATMLFRQFRELEDAGAFAVECELIPARVMAEINRRTGLTTVSLGSGPDADAIFLFMSDICGEGPRVPRHARSYGDVAALRRQIVDERIRALTAFRSDVRAGTFPSGSEIASIDDDEFSRFTAQIDPVDPTSIRQRPGSHRLGEAQM